MYIPPNIDRNLVIEIDKRTIITFRNSRQRDRFIKRYRDTKRHEWLIGDDTSTQRYKQPKKDFLYE